MSETYAYKSTVNFPSAPQSTSQVCTCTGIYVGIGAGLNIRAGRFGIRPELRFDDFQPTQNLQGQNYAGEGTVSLFYVFGGKPK
jgi:hypothetical protein